MNIEAAKGDAGTRTPKEALREVRDRLTYFCARLDGKYDPPWATELVGIIDDALAQDAPTPQGNMAAMRNALESTRNWCLNRLHNAPRQVTVEGLLSIIDAALSANPRVCDVYTAKDLKTIVFAEMGKHCVEGRIDAGSLEMVNTVVKCVVDGIMSEMKEGRP